MKWIKEKEIIDLMNKGWNLGYDTGWGSTHYWLQKGKLGYGGDTIKVHATIFWSMHKKGLFKKISRGDIGTREFILK